MRNYSHTGWFTPPHWYILPITLWSHRNSVFNGCWIHRALIFINRLVLWFSKMIFQLGMFISLFSLLFWFMVSRHFFNLFWCCCWMLKLFYALVCIVQSVIEKFSYLLESRHWYHFTNWYENLWRYNLERKNFVSSEMNRKAVSFWKTKRSRKIN